MAVKLRRRLRAGALRALTGSPIPAPLVRTGLLALSPLARFSRFERRTLANLELALGRETSAEERRKIARDVRHHSARLFAEWLRLSRGGEQAWVDRAVELDPSVAILDKALARGRGAIVVTAHIGNWELLCARVLRHGVKGAVVGLDRPRDPTTTWLVAMRQAYGVTTLPHDMTPREILRLLARGATIGLLADLEARSADGVFLPFLGVPALTMTAPAALARASGAPLVPARCVLEGDRYVLRVEEPIALDTSLARREATIDTTTRLNRILERWIREHPGQWAWHQPRWRTRP